MTRKERVVATINHREPDCVPVGEWGIDHDHVSAIIGHHTYWRNRKDTTIALWEGRRCDECRRRGTYRDTSGYGYKAGVRTKDILTG